MSSKVYVLYRYKQYKIEGVYTSLRKAAAAKEKLSRDGILCEIVTKVLNDTQESG